MAKFYGPVGYADKKQVSKGVWKGVTERLHYGDIIKNTRRLENGEQINGEIVLNNQLSIVADPYANEHFFAIKYVKWQGTYWTVTNAEVQRPRLLLTLGGVYNGETA